MTTTTLDLTVIETVRTLERRRIEAMGANDVAALAPLLDDSLIYINSLGRRVRQAASICMRSKRADWPTTKTSTFRKPSSGCSTASSSLSA